MRALCRATLALLAAVVIGATSRASVSGENEPPSAREKRVGIEDLTPVFPAFGLDARKRLGIIGA